MLAGGTDLLYRLALAAGHEPFVDVQVWGLDQLLAQDLTFLAGSVQASLTSDITRTLDMTVHESLYPTGPGDLLAPFGNEIRAFRGIRFGDGSRVSWPVFTGRITEAMLNPDGSVTVQAQDRAGDVADYGFITPGNSVVGALVGDEVKRIITDAVPGATFGIFDPFDARVPLLTWEHSRTSALDELATSVGAFWYALADGSFVLRRYPWTVRAAPVVTFADGDGGIVTASSAVRRRDGIYNSVTVTGERADGTTPVWATQEDENPASPTYVRGPFGRRNLQRQLNTPTNTEAASGAARLLLQRLTALTEAWSFSCVPDASLELGDVISLDVRGRKGLTQVVASISMPLDLRGQMSVTCRAQVVGQLEDA